MFLNKTIINNKQLIDVAQKMHQAGEMLPDSYIIDMDTLLENATKILNKSKKLNLKPYFMLKQLGRNPYIAKKFIELGYNGVVVVDFKEAVLMIDNNIPIGNVGHLVQIPKHLIAKVVNHKPEVFTVFSYDIIDSINKAANDINYTQELILKIYNQDDEIYNMQEGGFKLDELSKVVKHIKNLENVKLVGVTSFPCILTLKEDVYVTKNVETLKLAKIKLEKLGVSVTHVNMPSSTNLKSLGILKQVGATHVEPGHAFTGTTPISAILETGEKQAMLYVSEISHTLNGNSYCYGGGYYRRSYVENALIGRKQTKVLAPCNESIDYHFGIEGEFNVGETVIMNFRTQLFVTRSTVYLIENLEKAPKIIGVYQTNGKI
ncbi:MAG: alanine racemase [Spiroplasma sp.]|nr:alanine racemase [Mycoplasmatales bacterium]